MKVLKKIVLTLLITCILVTSMPIYALEKIVKTVKGDEDWDNALHFIVRHWHTTYDESEDSQTCVIVEGYIVPEGTKYNIYAVDENGKQEELNNNKKYNTDYIDSIDEKEGKITLKANPLKNNDGTPLESFSAFSLTSGNSAIKTEGEQVTISYHPDVHLVKIHTFYDNESLKVVGSGKEDAVFGSGDTQKKDDQDVAWVYTYIKAEDNHNVGDIVKNGDEPVYDKKDLPENLTIGKDVELTKVYSTLDGLHTDKTASIIEGEDREFTIDLESWYSGAKAADVGLVLDASGSMIFTSDALEPIHLDEKEIEEFNLGDKKLSKDKYKEKKEGPSTNAWNHDIFLTQAEVNEILNVHNTDNNPLGNSGYNYYVFNEAKEVNEYAPLGYWDGSLNDVLYDSVIGYYEFDKGKYDDTKDTDRRDWLKNSANDGEATVVGQIDSANLTNKTEAEFKTEKTPEKWSEDKRIKMKENKGFTVKNLQENGKEIEGVGVLLDAKPTSNNFTISFTVEKENKDEKNTKEADLIYIGPLENIETSDYYRVIRANNGSKNRLKVKDSNSNDDVSINNVFKDANQTCIITLVFENGKITSYNNGNKENDKENSQKNVNLKDNNIVIGGIDNNYDGSDIYIDNVCVFDTALSEKDVKRISFSETEEKEKEKECLAYNTFEEETDKLVKAEETAGNGETVINGEEKIAFVNKYFVDPVTGGMSGWYYVNHDSDLEKHYFDEKTQTGKVLWGVNNVETNDPAIYKDEIKTPTDVKAQHKNTEFTYKPDGNSPTLFYIDEEGYLCCFFTRGTKKETVGASFVYKKDDSKYIKAEALQRALGSFASELNEASPYSEISAVRYSSDKATDKNYDKFVLLDWTNDPTDVQNMMSLSYGNGGTTTGKESNHKHEGGETITQYNYGVTGGTATYVGLEAFEQFLADEGKEEADKYLIIFTDGKDTTPKEKQNKIAEDVKKLKEQGYTIMAVMLTGGSIEYSDKEESEYQTAKKFLLDIVGTSETEKENEEDKKQYFFSTAEVGNHSYKEADTIDKLTEIFTNDILERISDNLESYSIQDYIDPRFNLVSADGKEYKLDANGIVTILDKDGAKYDLKNGTTEQSKGEIKEDNGKHYLSVKLSNDSDVDIDTREARLYFDSDNNMYYLKWVKQTIPGCVVDAKILPVWNTRFTIKAKDDVLGGNAILTNGNAEKMNYVYSEGDSSASSGTDKCHKKEGENNSVSKGFPRVTVNIPTYEIEKESKQTIYMGESLDYKNIEKEMIKQVNEESEKENIKYFWEYLERYAKNNNEEKNYIEELLEKGTITIPYYYLPNKEKTNLAEDKTEHKEDKLGELVYEIKESGGNDGEVKDREKRTLTLTVTYKPGNIEERLKENEKLVKEEEYKWDEKYKPAVGEVQKEKEVIKNEHKIDIVSGEIALQVKFDSKVVEVMENEEIEYDVDLYRTYKGETKKVGTFKATWKKEDDNQPDDEGNITVTAKLEDLEKYMEENGLPLGTYTLGTPKIVKAPSYMKFDTTNVVKDAERYIDKLFTLGTDNNNPKKYLANLENNSEIILGDTEKTEGYLEKRFGLFEVKPIVVFEMPLAGSNSLMMIYIVAVGCIVTATILHKSIRLRIKKRKKVYKK